jgi:myosin heavy subunit
MPTIKDLKTYLKRFKDKNCPKLTGLKKDELTRLAYKYGYVQVGAERGMPSFKPIQTEQAPPTKRKPNPWLEYVKQVKAKNPSMAYKDVMKLAKETYKKGQPTTSAPKQEEKQREQKTKEESDENKIKRLTDERDKLESEIKKLNKIIDDENSSAKEAGKARDKKMPLLRKRMDIVKQIKDLTKLKAPAKETPAKKVYKKTDPVIIEWEKAPKKKEKKLTRGEELDRRVLEDLMKEDDETPPPRPSKKEKKEDPRGKGLRKPRTYGGGLSRDAHHRDVMTRGHVRY